MEPKRSDELLAGSVSDSEAHGNALMSILYNLEQIGAQLGVLINQQTEMMAMAGGATPSVPLDEVPLLMAQMSEMKVVVGDPDALVEVITDEAVEDTIPGDPYARAEEQGEAYRRRHGSDPQPHVGGDNEAPEDPNTLPDGPEDEGDEPQEDPAQARADAAEVVDADVARAQKAEETPGVAS